MSKEQLQVYNTLTSQKEPFVPNQLRTVKMYVCGPTTYNFIHLGNARPIVVFDTVRRYLEYLGYDVIYVQNFTDVDDKIIKKAQEENMKPSALAEKYIEEYYRDADALNVKRATIHPQVSTHIYEIIQFVQGLIDKGYAYEVDGDVYFAVERFESYGKLSKRNLADLQAGARVEVDERKVHPADFALWKKAKHGEPQWQSPWGMGRPGWHIECSAMSAKYLGPSFDIHAGGFDLTFPHHENEIAQSEALYGAPMAKYWMHNGFITVNAEKMSKSLGNFFLLREILEKYPPEVVRFYLLSTHYRSPLDFDDQKLEAAEKGYERLVTTYRVMEETLAQKESETKELSPDGILFHEQIHSLGKRFSAAMNDDFNTALALAVIFDFARQINIFIAGGVFGKESLKLLSLAKELLREFTDILGLKLNEQNKIEPFLVEYIERQIENRQEAKKNKDYKKADQIRDELKEKGVILEDTPQGVRWRVQK